MVIFEFKSLLSFLFRGTRWLLAASWSPLIKNRKLPEWNELPLKILFLTHITKEHGQNISWANAEYNTEWSKTLPEDGHRVKPKHARWNDPSWQPLHPVTNKWDQECSPLTLARRCLHPPSISSFPDLCVFVKQWILLCFSENWQEASWKLKMGAERLYRSLNKQPDRKDVWQAKVSG